MSLSLNSSLSIYTGLSLNQLTQAEPCGECRGAYYRLVNLHNQGSIEALCTSRAIEIINRKHPFNMDLVSKYTSLKNSDITPIITCSKPLCKCKNVWTDLKNELEIMDQGDQFSKSTPHENTRKMSIHALYILEETILDPEDLHTEKDPYLSM